ncbi:hypothetical protein ACIOHO_36195 [Streptomyces sp. NPDC087849]|uniref:hypothetical protein n=1 Tax=Streptomyces sp. NPDC087849 TaxID=3365808 RepID=UPI0038013593
MPLTRTRRPDEAAVEVMAPWAVLPEKDALGIEAAFRGDAGAQLRHTHDAPGALLDGRDAVFPFKSVLVNPGSVALIRVFGNAFAYCTVITSTAASDAEWAMPG